MYRPLQLRCSSCPRFESPACIPPVIIITSKMRIVLSSLRSTSNIIYHVINITDIHLACILHAHACNQNMYYTNSYHIIRSSDLCTRSLLSDACTMHCEWHHDRGMGGTSAGLPAPHTRLVRKSRAGFCKHRDCISMPSLCLP